MLTSARAIALSIVGVIAAAPLSAQPVETAAPPAPQSSLPESPASDSSGPELPIPVPPADAALPEIEPVISEEEFEEAVPDLEAGTDPALDAPLESIEEFERRLAAEEAAPSAGAAPEGQTTLDPLPVDSVLGDPILADQDPAELIGDAPITDSELAAPLPPLETFDVEPTEFAEQAAPAKEIEIAYDFEINGLEEADDETATALASTFKSLSALEDGDGTAANVAQISARLEEDAELIQRILASEGWFEASTATRIDRRGGSEEAGSEQGGNEGGGGETLVAVIEVLPGPRYALADIVIDAPPVEPENLIRDNIALQIGEPIVATRVQGAEAQVAVALPENGYPFATIGQRDILLDRETEDGVYTLPVEPGPRTTFGGIRTTGDLAFEASHVETLARFERGEVYDSRMVDDLRQALVATGLLDSVSVVPERSGELAPDGTEYATLLVEQEAGPPRAIAGSAGYGTGQGVRVEGSWTHYNMFPPEGALSVTGVAGTQEQGAGVTFRRSNAGRRDRTFQLSANALHSDYDAFEAFTGRIAALLSYTSTPIWQKRLTYAVGGHLTVSNEQDFNIASGERERRTFYIAGLSGQLGLDTTNDLLDPVEGFRLTAYVEPEGSLEDGFSPYVRARLDGSAYYGASESIVLAGRVRLGTIQGIDRFDLAPSRRFYAGGGGSVRGFGYQELGPRVLEPNPKYPDPEDIDPEDDPEDLPATHVWRPIGGRSLFEAAAEVRYRFGNFGVVGFVDAGQVYEESLPQFSDIRFGAGIGGRYYTNFGPMRLDIAMPLDKREGESSFAVYISIGQAF